MNYITINDKNLRNKNYYRYERIKKRGTSYYSEL